MDMTPIPSWLSSIKTRCGIGTPPFCACSQVGASYEEVAHAAGLTPEGSAGLRNATRNQALAP